MKKFISLLLVFVMLLCSLSAFAAYEVEYAGSASQNPLLKEIIKNATRNDGDGFMYPPEEHPYIFLNEEFIQSVKENRNTPEYKSSYDHILGQAQKPLPAQPAGGIISGTISSQLSCRAIMYAFGEVDKAHARQTADFAIEYIKNAKTKETYSISIYKDYGNNAIQTGAFVYDWCYNAMTPSQRTALAEGVRALMYSSDQPCRPDNTAKAWGDLNGKAVGQPILYMTIGATALYDQYPDMYEAVMRKVLGSMAEAANLYGSAGALTDGSIAYSREEYASYIQVLLQRMGLDESKVYGDRTRVGYKMLYSRLPYGTFIKTGDTQTVQEYQYGYYNNTGDISDLMGSMQVTYEDPYFKHYYARNNSNASDMISFLIKKSFHEAKTPDELPLAFEAYSPRSEIIHKTSWQEGFDSPQVTAYLNMNNRRSGDHDHAESGTFQLYYKGPLSIANGMYWGEGWGREHWRNYNTRTVSKNGLLVYDPSEVYMYGPNRAEANDGGQMMVSSASGGYVITELKEHFADTNLRTITEATYIGPNEKTPAFSYIKGDLTKAYSQNKMASYKRSMVFMDTFNKTYPGILVVFDRVVSKKAEFPKTWLLQAVDEPLISGNKMTIRNDKIEENANGKLVNTLLYPENANIETVGGNKLFISDGKEWAFDSGMSGSDLYHSGWRVEVKPKTAATEDLFLNAMYVADADSTAPDVEMIKVENEHMMGVVALDRQVMFKKDASTIDKSFEVEVINNNGGENMLVLLTDIAPGKWKVSGNGINLVFEVSEDDMAFTFEGKPGKYTIIPESEEAEVSEIEWPEAEKEKIGDFAVRLGSQYQYMRTPTKLVNGVPYYPASFVIENLGISAKKEGDKFIVTSGNGKIITLTAGSATYQVNTNGVVSDKTTQNPPFIGDNEEFYFSSSDSIGGLIGFNSTYNTVAKAAICTLSSSGVASTTSKLNGVDETKVIWPVAIITSSDDGNIPDNTIDRDLNTRWSSLQGDGEWIAFNLGEEALEMSAVQIAWYNGDKRNWKFDIQISDDGENWKDVLKGLKSAGKSMDVETFQLPAGTKAKFIRYLGHGEEVTGSLYNSVTEFIIVK